jgi:hypothetical protein
MWMHLLRCVFRPRPRPHPTGQIKHASETIRRTPCLSSALSRPSSSPIDPRNTHPMKNENQEKTKSAHVPPQLPNCSHPTKAPTLKTSRFPAAIYPHHAPSSSIQRTRFKTSLQNPTKIKPEQRKQRKEPGCPPRKLGHSIMHHAEQANDEEGPCARGAEMCCEGDRLEGQNKVPHPAWARMR